TWSEDMSSDLYSISQSDGITMTQIIYANNQYIVSGISGNIITSSDGITWKQTPNITTYVIQDLIYTNNQYFAVGNVGTILNSLDGQNWSGISSSISNNLYSMTYGNSLYVTVGNSGTILNSVNGQNWNNKTNTTITNQILYSVTVNQP
ncbi:MAG: hypothetical protein RLZZ293_617, partial [Pseudomonadota bacterium]